MKVRTVFRCQDCGTGAPRWVGRCPGCGEWNTLVEELRERSRSQSRPARAAIAPQRLSDIAADEAGRISTGSAEFDRVLGGGLVSGSLVLVGGEPGVGKSSLLLQSLGAIGAAGHSTDRGPGRVGAQ